MAYAPAAAMSFFPLTLFISIYSKTISEMRTKRDVEIEDYSRTRNK